MTDMKESMKGSLRAPTSEMVILVLDSASDWGVAYRRLFLSFEPPMVVKDWTTKALEEK